MQCFGVRGIIPTGWWTPAFGPRAADSIPQRVDAIFIWRLTWVWGIGELAAPLLPRIVLEPVDQAPASWVDDQVATLQQSRQHVQVIRDRACGRAIHEPWSKDPLILGNGGRAYAGPSTRGRVNPQAMQRSARACLGEDLQDRFGVIGGVAIMIGGRKIIGDDNKLESVLID